MEDVKDGFKAGEIEGRLKSLEGWAKRNHDATMEKLEGIVTEDCLDDKIDIVTEEYLDDKMEGVVTREHLDEKINMVLSKIEDFCKKVDCNNLRSGVMEHLRELKARLANHIESTDSDRRLHVHSHELVHEINNRMVKEERFDEFEKNLNEQLKNLELQIKSPAIDEATLEELERLYNTEQYSLKGAVVVVKTAEKSVPYAINAISSSTAASQAGNDEIIEAINGLRKDLDIENVEQKTEAFWKKMRDIMKTSTERDKGCILSAIEGSTGKANDFEIQVNWPGFVKKLETTLAIHRDLTEDAITKRVHNIIYAEMDASNTQTKDLIREEITKVFANWKAEINRHAGIGNVSYWKTVDTHLEKTFDVRIGAMEEKMEKSIQRKFEDLRRSEFKVLGFKGIENKILELEGKVVGMMEDVMFKGRDDVLMELQMLAGCVRDMRKEVKESGGKLDKIVEKGQNVPESVRKDWQWMGEIRA